MSWFDEVQARPLPQGADSISIPLEDPAGDMVSAPVRTYAATSRAKLAKTIKALGGRYKFVSEPQERKLRRVWYLRWLGKQTQHYCYAAVVRWTVRSFDREVMQPMVAEYRDATSKPPLL
jgi:hypothetical protein